MDIKELQLQCITDSQRWFPSTANELHHHVLGLAGEVGEVAEIVKKIDRGSRTMNDEQRMAIGEELVDVLIYVCNAAAVIEVDLDAMYKVKREFNEQRFG